MLQLSLKILLAVLMFVNLAFTIPIEDLASKKSENITNTNKHVLEKDKIKDVDRNVIITDHSKTSLDKETSSTILPTTLQNSNLTSYPSALEKEKNQNTTERPVEETTPINQVTEIKNTSNLTGEQKDLIEGFVSPRDEEDVTTIVVPTLDKNNSSVSTVTEATSSFTTLESINKTSTVNDPIPKEKHNNETSDNEDKYKVKNITYQVNTSESINVTTEIIETSTATSKSTEVTTIGSSENDQVEVGISTVTVKKEKEVVEQVESNIKSKPLSTNEKDSSGSMPPGIIVLVTALTFAVVIVVGYISIVIWKQYLEHRYGRRELLVNELEFDTNDLRHFEL